MKKPSMRAFVVLASLAAAAGCAPLHARSSASVLGPARSSAVVLRGQSDAADLVAQAFAARGFVLTGERLNGASILLRFEGTRRAPAGPRHAYEVGSAVYAFVAPHGEDRSAVTIVGRPIFEGAELCTRDLILAAEGCRDHFANHASEAELDGRAEAHLVHGVFAELGRRGEVDAAQVLRNRLVAAQDLCQVQRSTQLEHAMAQRDARARAVAHGRAVRGD